MARAYEHAQRRVISSRSPAARRAVTFALYRVEWLWVWRMADEPRAQAPLNPPTTLHPPSQFSDVTDRGRRRRRTARAPLRLAHGRLLVHERRRRELLPAGRAAGRRAGRRARAARARARAPRTASREVVGRRCRAAWSVEAPASQEGPAAHSAAAAPAPAVLLA
jgi:hypothetical protein